MTLEVEFGFNSAGVKIPRESATRETRRCCDRDSRFLSPPPFHIFYIRIYFPLTIPRFRANRGTAASFFRNSQCTTERELYDRWHCWLVMHAVSRPSPADLHHRSRIDDSVSTQLTQEICLDTIVLLAASRSRDLCVMQRRGIPVLAFFRGRSVDLAMPRRDAKATYIGNIVKATSSKSHR